MLCERDFPGQGEPGAGVTGCDVERAAAGRGSVAYVRKAVPGAGDVIGVALSVVGDRRREMAVGGHGDGDRGRVSVSGDVRQRFPDNSDQIALDVGGDEFVQAALDGQGGVPGRGGLARCSPTLTRLAPNRT